VSPADDGGGESHEGFVDVVADLPADAQAAEPVRERDRSLDHPPVDAQAEAVLRSPPRWGRTVRGNGTWPWSWPVIWPGDMLITADSGFYSRQLWDHYAARGAA